MKNSHVITIVGGAVLLGAIVGKMSEPTTPESPCVEGESDCSSSERSGPMGPAKRERPLDEYRPSEALDVKKEAPKRPPPRQQRPAKAQARLKQGDIRNVDVFSDDASIGPASAKVTIVEFSNFQCSYCAKGAATVKQAVDAYGDQVRLVFKHHPLRFHKDAPLAHQAAIEAHKQGKFWAFHDRLFESRSLKRDALESHAQALGLDMTRFKHALDTGLHAAQVDRDVKQAAALGATGTPAFFINGRFLSGAQPLERFKQMIDEALAGQ